MKQRDLVPAIRTDLNLVVLGWQLGEKIHIDSSFRVLKKVFEKSMQH